MYLYLIIVYLTILNKFLLPLICVLASLIISWVGRSETLILGISMSDLGKRLANNNAICY